MTYYMVTSIILALLAGTVIALAERYLKERNEARRALKALYGLFKDSVKEHEKSAACEPQEVSLVGHLERASFHRGCVSAMQSAMESVDLYIQYSGGGWDDVKVRIYRPGNPILNYFGNRKLLKALRGLNPDKFQNGFRAWALEKGYVRDTTVTDKEVYVKDASRLEISTEA